MLERNRFGERESFKLNLSLSKPRQEGCLRSLSEKRAFLRCSFVVRTVRFDC